jgi:amino acid transporter
VRLLADRGRLRGVAEEVPDSVQALIAARLDTLSHERKSLLLALVHAEVGGMYPVAGGTARFPHYAFGGAAGASFGWFSWLQAAAVAPIEVLAMIQYGQHYDFADDRLEARPRDHARLHHPRDERIFRLNPIKPVLDLMFGNSISG